MTTTLAAIFDGRVFVPEQPVNIPSRARCKLVVETEDFAPALGDEETVDDEWLLEQVARLPAPDLPTNYAAQHDHYLYGTPKR